MAFYVCCEHCKYDRAHPLRPDRHVGACPAAECEQGHQQRDTAPLIGQAREDARRMWRDAFGTEP